jgi:3-isopropylmalate/(R)-2-methylmalate dehydratase small subunit
MDYGFRALIGSSFAEIFFGNCLQNGILAVILPEDAVRDLAAAVAAQPGAQVTIDLPNQSVTGPSGETFSFDINPVRKDRLVKGMDDIDVTRGHADAIAAVEARRRAAYPWMPRTSQA